MKCPLNFVFVTKVAITRYLITYSKRRFVTVSNERLKAH